MINRRSLISTSFVLPILASLAFPAAAAEWPEKSIRLIVGSSAGGNADVIARVLAAEIEAKTKQKVIVENLAAASGTGATVEVSNAPADGYTWLFGTASHLVHNLALFDMPVDVSKTIRGAALINSAPGVLLVGKDHPAKDLASFIERAKGQPGKVIIGSGPAGTTTNILGLVFADRAGVKLEHLAFPSSPEAVRDVIAGRIDGVFDISVTALPHVTGGEVRALGVAAPRRLEQAPGVPTISEAGVKDFAAGTWNSIALPAGTPDDVVVKVNELVNGIVQSPAMKNKLQELGTQVPASFTPAEVDGFYKAERELWVPIVRAANQKVKQ